MLDIALVTAIVVLLAVYVSWRAGRLDRLHARLEAARAALDAALLRRNCVAAELASSGLLDPATSVLLAEAAHDARAGTRQRELAESDLSRALRAAFGQPDFRASLDGGQGAEELLAELEAAAHQVFLARKFYNEAVSAVDLGPAPLPGPGAAAGRAGAGARVLRDRRLAGRARR